MKKDGRRCMLQFKQRQRIHSFSCLFHSGFNRLGDAHPRWWGWSLSSLRFKGLSLPETSPQTHPEIMFYQLSGHPLAQFKFAQKFNHQSGQWLEMGTYKLLHHFPYFCIYLTCIHLCMLDMFIRSDQIRSDQSLSNVRLFATPWIAARQASLSLTNSQSSLRLTSIESMMPSSHLILCHPLLLLPPIPPSIRVFSNEYQ